MLLLWGSSSVLAVRFCWAVSVTAWGLGGERLGRIFRGNVPFLCHYHEVIWGNWGLCLKWDQLQFFFLFFSSAVGTFHSWFLSPFANPQFFRSRFRLSAALFMQGLIRVDSSYRFPS